MGRKVNAGSRVSRRVGTKSGIRLDCQRKTRGAANRARKSVSGLNRHSQSYAETQYERWLETPFAEKSLISV